MVLVWISFKKVTRGCDMYLWSGCMNVKPLVYNSEIFLWCNTSSFSIFLWGRISEWMTMLKWQFFAEGRDRFSCDYNEILFKIINLKSFAILEWQQKRILGALSSTVWRYIKLFNLEFWLLENKFPWQLPQAFFVAFL